MIDTVHSGNLPEIERINALKAPNIISEYIGK